MIPFDYKTPDFGNKFYTKQWGKLIKAWKWYNEKEEWIFCTVCYGKENIVRNISGEKERKICRTFKTFIYENDEWIISENIFSFYNIPGILNSGLSIVIVDNEMSIDILNKTNKKDFIFTTWNGDLSILEKLDFSIFNNKSVYYFSSSWILSKNIIVFLNKKIKNIIIIPPMIERPGWNISDDLEKMELTSELIKQWILIEKKEFLEKPEGNNFIENIEWPFKILGHGAGYFFFLHGENGEIFKAKQGSINNSHLQHLAPLEFWRDYFGYETKKGTSISWINAIDTLIRHCNDTLPFDHNKIRGRGIWQDGDELVIHTGRELITGNKKIDIREYSPNGHVYERLTELKLSIKKLEINNFEIGMIRECINKLSIHSDFEKICLLGWSLLAPFGGGLEWRPHIWLTGPAGSGKSAIIDHIIIPLLGDFGFYPEGGSSGAGIFQGLRNDCFPVVHDEVDKKWADLLQELEFARSASSSQKFMYKGTADQTGKRYQYNSMFCLSSVNHILEKKSDKSRFTIINITKNLKYNWKDFKKEIYKSFQDDICEKVRSFFFYNWKSIKENIKNFKDWFGMHFGDQRMGDQIGTLFASTFSFYELKVYKSEEIQKICEKYTENYTIDNDTTDELELLMKIFTTKITYTGYDNIREDTTLLNLLKRAAGEMNDNTHDPRARQELYKYGINYNDKKETVNIAYKYEWIKTILMNTPWLNNYGDVLRRLNFADKKLTVCYFGAYYHGRAVILKAKNVLRLSDDEIFMEAGF